MTAEAQSLVEWVNSFGVGECHSLKGLSSGTLLFNCMRNVLPVLRAESGQEWEALLQELTDFCRCSLDQSLSRELIEAGDEEHLARAVVLLLCLAVQRKPNEDIIAKITTLTYEAQRDIMYFIEETLAKINSNALSSGLFTSGVGDVVSQLSGRTSPDVVEEEEAASEAMEGVQTTDASGYSTPQPTPNRLSKPPSRAGLFACPSSLPRLASRHKIHQASSYYNGLESPAALKWMKNPVPRREGVANPSTGNSADQLEEILRLKHRVRVLERSLANEQTLSQEMHAALCQKERETQELQGQLHKTRDAAERARELADVQDELQTVSEALERSEKCVLRLQREVEEQQQSQEEELGKREADSEHFKTENCQLKELLEKAVVEEVEQRSEVKRLQLAGETAAIAFHAKQRECDSLLQLNREHSTDIRELKQRSASLQKQLTELKDTSAEREKTLTDENHTLSLKLHQVQEQLGTAREEQRRSEQECETAKQAVAVAEAGSVALLEQYQLVTGEMEGLRTAYNMTQGELEEARAVRETLGSQLREKDEELGGVCETLAALRKSSREEIEEARGQREALQNQLNEKEEELRGLHKEMIELNKALEGRREEARETEEQLQNQLRKTEEELAGLCEQYSELKKTFEEKREEAVEQNECLQSQLREKEEELGALRDRLSGIVKEAEGKAREMEEQLEERKREIEEAQQTSADQIKTLEELLSGAHEKLSSLSERYTTEAEEMAAVKASLEEDLCQANSELCDTRRELAEREEDLCQANSELRDTRRELAEREEDLCQANSELCDTRRELAETEEELCQANSELRDTRRELAEREEELCQANSELCDTRRELAEREEELCQANSELCDTRRELAEREEYLNQAESDLDQLSQRLTDKEMECGDKEQEFECAREKCAALESELKRVGGELEGAKREKTKLEEKKGKVEGKLQDMTAWVEVKEARWEAERAALENRTVELSCTVESLTNKTRSLEAREEQREREHGEEREGWAEQRVLLEQKVATLTGELDSVSAKCRDQEREVVEMKSAVEKAQSLADSLQTEVTRKKLAVEALEQTVEKTREEWRAQREEGEERERGLLAGLEAAQRRLEEVVEETREEWRAQREEGEERERGLLAGLEAAQRRLEEVVEERERAHAELEHIKIESKHSLARLEAEYQNAVAEKERAHETYSGQLRSLEETNAALQRQQSEASAENTLIQEKQADLYSEMTALQDTKAEAMELVRLYEGMYNEERERRQADRELIRKMREERMSEEKTVTTESDSLRRQLSDEKRSTARLGAENRSLKAQVSFLENKLRDMERTRSTTSARLQTTRPSHTNTLTSEPYHHSANTFTKNDLGVSHITTDVLISSHPLSARDEIANTTFSDSVFSAPSHHSTAVKQPAVQSTRSSSRGEGRGEDNESRILELKSRNRRVLPHLKSSYAVELQEKNSNPCILGGQPHRMRKRAVGNNTSIRLTSDSLSFLEEPSRKRTSGSRKLAGDLGSSGSPVSTRRRISDPETTTQHTLLQPLEALSYDPRRATMDPRYNLRGCREDENNSMFDKEQDEGLPSASMFEMNFSPPTRGPKRPAAELPERLRQRLAKQEKPVSEASTKQEKLVSTASSIGGKKAGKTTKTHAGKRAALRAKN